MAGRFFENRRRRPHVRSHAARVRFVLVAVAALAAVLVLEGCIVIKSQTSRQVGILGSVRITLTACASGSSSSGPCQSGGNDGEAPLDGQSNVQALVGFRVPAGSTAPTGFDSTSTGPNNTGPQLHFTQSSSYASELQRLDPAPAGSSGRDTSPSSSATPRPAGAHASAASGAHRSASAPRFARPGRGRRPRATHPPPARAGRGRPR
jgi:hypothetical protein